RTTEESTLVLDIPAGVEDGLQIRYQGRGDAGQYGGPPGDLYVELRVTPHPLFRRRDDDLVCTLNVPLTVAALGGALSLETLEGPAQIEPRGGPRGWTAPAAATSSSSCRWSPPSTSTTSSATCCGASRSCARSRSRRPRARASSPGSRAAGADRRRPRGARPPAGAPAPGTAGRPAGAG